MKLVGPWLSGPTRRVGITMKLLEISFDHLPLHAYLQRNQVSTFSPMGKVPALVLEDGQTLLNSGSIIDFLHELVGYPRALLPAAGLLRRQALQLTGIADAVYEKLSCLYDESLRPPGLRMPELVDRWTAQVQAGFSMLEAASGAEWLVGAKLTQADIYAVVVFQSGMALLPRHVHDAAYPRLARLAGRAMELSAFRETFPFAV